jgi:hypothetical protein
MDKQYRIFTSPRCDIPTPTVTTRFRMQSVNAPLVYSNEIEFIPASSAISCYGLTQVTNASFNESCLGTPTLLKVKLLLLH